MDAITPVFEDDCVIVCKPVNVFEPNVASVPLVGNVTFVFPVTVKVVVKAPLVVKAPPKVIFKTASIAALLAAAIKESTSEDTVKSGILRSYVI